MFEDWTPQEVAEYREAIAMTDAFMAGQNPHGVHLSTINRWLEKRTEADAGNPRALLRKRSTGRPPLVTLPQDAADRLRRTVLKCGSTAMAVQHFADDPLCPDELRDLIVSRENPHALPLSLRRLANVSPEAKARFRGPVAYSHIAFKCRHGRQVIDPATDEARDLLAGDLYISDDMSRNRYFWFELPDPEIATRSNRGDKLAHKYGVALGRQGLYTMDAAGKWLGVTLVGCARDAYTSADVLRHMRATLADYGKPRIGWILEKGCWAARTVDGQKVWVPEEERAKLVGGLGSLGFLVEHVHTSEGKALIEGGFNQLQKAHSLFDGAPDIGRKRGEMEAESKLISRIQAGTLHPADCGLEHISEALQNDFKAMAYLNGKAKFGRIQNGVPDERWIQDTRRAPLAKIETKDGGVFMPIKHETHIRQGCVEKKIGGEIFRFTIPELFGELGAGYRLMLTFDDSNPAAGAELYNLETGARNARNWGFHEWIGHAEWENARPLYGYSDQVAESIERRKRHHRGFVAAYAGTGIFGKRATVALEARDGHGQVSLVEKREDVRGQKSAVSSQSAEVGSRPVSRVNPVTQVQRNPRRALNRFQLVEA